MEQKKGTWLSRNGNFGLRSPDQPIHRRLFPFSPPTDRRQLIPIHFRQITFIINVFPQKLWDRWLRSVWMLELGTKGWPTGTIFCYPTNFGRSAESFRKMTGMKRSRVRLATSYPIHWMTSTHVTSALLEGTQYSAVHHHRNVVDLCPLTKKKAVKQKPFSRQWWQKFIMNSLKETTSIDQHITEAL